MGVASAIVGSALVGAGASIYASKRASDAGQDAADRAADTNLQIARMNREDLAPWHDAGVNALRRLQGGYNEVDQDWLAQNPAPRKSDYMQTKYVKHGPGTYNAFDELGYQRAMEDWDATKPPGSYREGLLDAGPGEFEESPGYQFALKEGQQSIQNALSAMGRNRSGAHIKAAGQYGTDLASGEYDNFLNRYYQSLNPYLAMAGMGQVATGTSGGLTASGGRAAAGAYLAGGQAQGAGYINMANALTSGIRGAGTQLLYQNYLKNLPGAPGAPGGAQGQGLPNGYWPEVDPRWGPQGEKWGWSTDPYDYLPATTGKYNYNYIDPGFARGGSTSQGYAYLPPVYRR